MAQVRKVVASIGPVSGALLLAGTVSDPANDTGDSPNFDASTMPATMDVSAMRKP